MVWTAKAWTGEASIGMFGHGLGKKLRGKRGVVRAGIGWDRIGSVREGAAWIKS